MAMSKLGRSAHALRESTQGTLDASREVGAVATGTLVVGGFALGALTVGALAIGALAIGRLAIGRARIGRLEIEELSLRRLVVTEELRAPQVMVGELSGRGPSAPASEAR